MKQPVAIVTGSNRGLGKETVRQLAAKGYSVLLTARKLDNAQRAAKELNYNSIVPLQLDISDQDSVDEFVTRVAALTEQVDVIVNNAAIHYDTWQNALNADLSIVEEAMNTNVYGAWRLVKALIPLLRKSVGATVVNVSSGAGALENMTGGAPAYSLSKIALNALTVMLHNQLNQDGISVNAVCPGWVATDMGGKGGRPVEEGAKGIVWVATLLDKHSSGGFYRDGQRIHF